MPSFMKFGHKFLVTSNLNLSGQEKMKVHRMLFGQIQRQLKHWAENIAFEVLNINSN